MKISSRVLFALLGAALMPTACTKKGEDLSLTKGVVESPHPGCGFWVVQYGDSVGMNVQRLMALNLPPHFQKADLKIRFKIEAGIAPQIVCTTLLPPPPDPKYISNVQLR